MDPHVLISEAVCFVLEGLVHFKKLHAVYMILRSRVTRFLIAERVLVHRYLKEKIRIVLLAEPYATAATVF